VWEAPAVTDHPSPSRESVLRLLEEGPRLRFSDWPTQFLAAWIDGRKPQYSGVTVRVNGSSGQVVSIDDDPNAPASAMNPRAWTFIDGRWQFDNC
jgi:hypothetical protein